MDIHPSTHRKLHFDEVEQISVNLRYTFNVENDDTSTSKLSKILDNVLDSTTGEQNDLAESEKILALEEVDKFCKLNPETYTVENVHNEYFSFIQLNPSANVDLLPTGEKDFLPGELVRIRELYYICLKPCKTSTLNNATLFKSLGTVVNDRISVDADTIWGIRNEITKLLVDRISKAKDDKNKSKNFEIMRKYIQDFEQLTELSTEETMIRHSKLLKDYKEEEYQFFYAQDFNVDMVRRIILIMMFGATRIMTWAKM